MRTWTDLLGKPQGNEMPYGKEIVRQVGPFEFVTLWKTHTNKLATEIYYEWVKENEWVYYHESHL